MNKQEIVKLKSIEEFEIDFLKMVCNLLTFGSEEEWTELDVWYQMSKYPHIKQLRSIIQPVYWVVRQRTDAKEYLFTEG
jgi:hypothetical protein